MKTAVVAAFLALSVVTAHARPQTGRVDSFTGDRYAARTAMMSAGEVATESRRHRAGARRHKRKHHGRVIHARHRQIAPASRITLAEGIVREAGRALGPRPRAWCGWYLGRLLGRHDRRLWLARNWAGEGTNAGGPGIGVVVVWRHHVGIITGRRGTQWVVKSGNDSHRVRERPRSLAGAIAFRRMAS